MRLCGELLRRGFYKVEVEVETRTKKHLNA
jgi:hypothetical protein